MGVGNSGNLHPYGKGYRSEEEERASQRKGGVNSGVTRRKKKAMREAARLLLSMDVTKKDVKDKIRNYGIEDKDIDNQMAVMVAMLIQATRGNVKAAEFICDTMGENPEVQYKFEELKQRKAEFEYQKQKDAELNNTAGNEALAAWAEKVKSMREESKDGES